MVHLKAPPEVLNQGTLTLCMTNYLIKVETTVLLFYSAQLLPQQTSVPLILTLTLTFNM